MPPLSTLVDANGHINDAEMRSTLLPESAFQQPFGIRIRLPNPTEPGNAVIDGPSGSHAPHPTLRASVVGKLADSVVFTYANDAFPSTHPTVHITPTPTHIIGEIFTVRANIEDALPFKINEWNENRFREYVEFAIGSALDSWACKDFNRTFIATDHGVISQPSHV